MNQQQNRFWMHQLRILDTDENNKFNSEKLIKWKNIELSSNPPFSRLDLTFHGTSSQYTWKHS